MKLREKATQYHDRVIQYFDIFFINQNVSTVKLKPSTTNVLNKLFETVDFYY